MSVYRTIGPLVCDMACFHNDNVHVKHFHNDNFISWAYFHNGFVYVRHVLRPVYTFTIFWLQCRYDSPRFVELSCTVVIHSRTVVNLDES